MQRIIAYIYRYKGEGNLYRKCGNVGFCRVEDVGGRRMINMCFKETHNITMDCEISGIYLDESDDKNMCRCSLGKKLRNDKINGGQMRIRMQGDNEEGLYILSGNERYIVLWNGDREAVLLQEQSKSSVKEHIINTNLFKEENEEKFIERNNEKISQKNSDEIFDEVINNEERKKSEVVKNKNEEEQLLRAYNRLAKYPMIIDNKMQQVVKMKPQQMIMLPRKYWRLTNNPFLMECFYTHKHILFFKYNDCFVIGVPAVGRENEEVYARQFGFKNVSKGCDYNKPTVIRQYWLYELG